MYFWATTPVIISILTFTTYALLGNKLTAGIRGYLIFLSVFNVLLAICSSLGNILILIALHKATTLHAPSKLFLRSLATTDLLVGVISEPLTVTYWISAVRKRWDECYNIFLTSFIMGYLLCGISLLTMTAISVDRLLALSLRVRYKQIVTLTRHEQSFLYSGFFVLYGP